MRLAGKVAVVTGASTGIGLAAAKRLHADGARVAIAGRTRQTLDEVARSIGERVACIEADVAKLSDLERLLRCVADELGRIDVLFVNAGIGRFAPLATTSEALYDELFATNTKGSFFTLQKALPYLNDGASVIFNRSHRSRRRRVVLAQAHTLRRRSRSARLHKPPPSRVRVATSESMP